MRMGPEAIQCGGMRIEDIVNLSQIWLIGRVERTAYSLTNQWMISRRIVCLGWNFR